MLKLRICCRVCYPMGLWFPASLFQHSTQQFSELLDRREYRNQQREVIARTYLDEVAPTLGQGPGKLVVAQAEIVQLHQHIIQTLR